MSSNYHTPYAFGTALTAALMNAPLGQLDQTITDVLDGTQEVSRLQVGAGAAEASAAVQINSTTKGFLPPRMTTAQRDAIGTPATGLLVYNTTTNQLNYYDGAWQVVGNVGGALTEIIPETAIANSSGISLTGISQSYQDLILRLRIRSDTAAENDVLRLRFNNASGASDYAWTQFYAAAASSVLNDAADSEVELRVPAANATANRFLEVSVRLHNYTHTDGQFFGYFDGTLADDVFYMTWGGFLWISGGAAMNRIDFDMASAATFDGSYALYGLGTPL